MSGINALLIAGSGERSFCGTLAELVGESSLDGIRVTVFDSLELPPFSETAPSVAKLAGEVNTVDEVAPDFAQDTNCPPRHHRGADVVLYNNCAGAQWSNNELLARPPQTTFVKELP
jgi:hypothetical protein